MGQPAKSTTGSAKPDQIAVAATEQALTEAKKYAEDFGVGEYLGYVTEGNRIVTHMFSCPHPGYVGWYWAVTMVRAARAKSATVSEVVMLPGEDSLVAPKWVPWKDRLEPEDLVAGTILPTPDNDPRLEPGFSFSDVPADTEPAEASQVRAVVHELGLGRQRVLSAYGRDEAAKRWQRGEGGPNNQITKQAGQQCVSCGYFLRLSGSLGNVFGVCANEWTPFDAKVVSYDHGCGAHSDVVEHHRPVTVEAPVFDTITPDNANLFG